MDGGFEALISATDSNDGKSLHNSHREWGGDTITFPSTHGQLSNQEFPWQMIHYL